MPDERITVLPVKPLAVESAKGEETPATPDKPNFDPFPLAVFFVLLVLIAVVAGREINKSGGAGQRLPWDEEIQAFFKRGNAWLEKKEYDKAIEEYDEAIRLYEIDLLSAGYASLFHNRAIAWAGKKEYDKAIADYDEAVRRDPDKASTYRCRGSAWAEKKEGEKADKDFRTARRLDGIPEVWMQLKSGDTGRLAGTVHNDTGKVVEKIRLSIKTSRWDRVYDVKVSVENNTTATFSVFVGDDSLAVDSFAALKVDGR